MPGAYSQIEGEKKLSLYLFSGVLATCYLALSWALRKRCLFLGSTYPATAGLTAFALRVRASLL